MGGSSGGGVPIGDLSYLQGVAKQKLKDAADQATSNVFISFAYEDLEEVNLLRGQAKNENSELVFSDYSVKEPFDSKNADYIRSQISEKIEKSSVTVVFLSSDSAKSKWVDWEIKESIRQGKGVVGVYQGEKLPKSLPESIDTRTISIVPWKHSELNQAIQAARKNRS